jgi:hypothetical protein
LQTLSCYNALIIFSKFKLSNKMKNITENPQNISELLKAKVESFQVEELDSRLEMNGWKVSIDIPVGGNPAPAPTPVPPTTQPTFPEGN